MSDDKTHQDALAKLLDSIEDINPRKLSSISHRNYLNKLARDIGDLLKTDPTVLLILISSIKECPGPGFKRDMLIQVLSDITTKKESLWIELLCDTFNASSDGCKLWKSMATAVTSIPDLVANSGLLSRYPIFEPDNYNKLLASRLLKVFHKITSLNAQLSYEQRLFLAYIVGRLSQYKNRKIVWTELTSKVITSDDVKLKTFVRNLMKITTDQEDENSHLFEMFIESYYSPLFYYLEPSEHSGVYIESLIPPSSLENKTLQYIICNKYLLQTNHNLDKRRQHIILVNIFIYLAQLSQVNRMSEGPNERAAGVSGTASNKQQVPPDDTPSLLISTLIGIAKSWSNVTKILLRTYEQSRFITTAFAVALKYALASDSQCLAKYWREVHMPIVDSVPVYLNRAASENRNLAMCLCEIAIPELQSVCKNTTRDNTNAELEVESKMFSTSWDADCLEIRRLFYLNVNDFFAKTDSRKEGAKVDEANESSHQIPEDSSQTAKTSQNDSLLYNNKTPILSAASHSSKIAVASESNDEVDKKITSLDAVEAKKGDAYQDDESDDLVPYDQESEINEDVEGSDEVTMSGEDVANVPIYLSDCINGLVENQNARYVKLCLLKAGELIDKLIEQEFSENVSTEVIQLSNDRLATRRPYINHSIRDVAVELAQALLYLDDLFAIDSFDELRMNAMTKVCVGAPELAAKYLLDEFNGSTRNTRHQLDILQALVASAQEISGRKSRLGAAKTNAKSAGQTNAFAEFGSLYFYGIIHKLKVDLQASRDIQPTSIVSALRASSSAGARGNSNSNRRQTMLSKVIIGLADSKAQLDGLDGKSLKLSSLISMSSGVGDSGHKTSSESCKHARDDYHRLRESAARNYSKEEAAMDDSYLLSRILFSISLIIKCLHHQPVVCKLSNDLLDILAAYRYHPDSGVRRALVICLEVIRDCTPSVYLKTYLQDKTVALFGSWLAAIR